MPHKRFVLSPYLSTQNTATSSETQQTRLHVQTDGGKKRQILHDSSSFWGHRWTGWSSMNHAADCRHNGVLSGLTVLYLKGCASWMNVMGQLPRTPCSPLSMVPHLMRQQKSMKVLFCSHQRAQWTQSLMARWDSCPHSNALNWTLSNVRGTALSQQSHPSVRH